MLRPFELNAADWIHCCGAGGLTLALRNGRFSCNS